MSFKEDWKKASKKERNKYILIIAIELVAGFSGIGFALLFAKNMNYALLIPTVIMCLITMIASRVKWQDKEEVC